MLSSYAHSFQRVHIWNRPPQSNLSVMVTYYIHKKFLKVHVNVCKSHLTYIIALSTNCIFRLYNYIFLPSFHLRGLEIITDILTRFWSRMHEKFRFRIMVKWGRKRRFFFQIKCNPNPLTFSALFWLRYGPLDEAWWRWMRKKGRRTWGEFLCTSPHLSAITTKICHTRPSEFVAEKSGLFEEIAEISGLRIRGQPLLFVFR